MCAGFTVFIPHLTHYVEEHAILTGMAAGQAYDMWLRQDIDWLAECDAMVYLAKSRGADIEKAFAEEHGIRVYYTVEEAIERLQEVASDV